MTTKVTNIVDIFTVAFSCLGITASLDQVGEVLQIILLGISILNILIVIFLRVYKILQDGKVTKEELDDLVKDAKETEEKIKELRDEDK